MELALGTLSVAVSAMYTASSGRPSACAATCATYGDAQSSRPERWLAGPGARATAESDYVSDYVSD